MPDQPLRASTQGGEGPGVRPPVMIPVEHSVATRLRRAAAERGMPVKSLICELLDVIASDKLVDAVLDDTR
jgi:hypothetical protein